MNMLVDCSADFKKIVGLVKNVVFLLKVIAPIVLVIMGSVDFLLATIAKDEQDMEKAKKRFVSRIIMAAAVFLLLSFMELINSVLAAVGIKSEWIACWGLK